MKTLAAIQSSYIPWRGFFDVIAAVDEFLLLDEVQYTKRDWRNRNRIVAGGEARWLTIPVNVKGRYDQRIDEVTIADPGWAGSHLSTLRQAYAAAPAFAETWDLVESAYGAAAESERLSDVNRHLLEAICERLGIETPIRFSTEYESRGEKSERLISLCLAAGADEYLSGPAAKAYLDVEGFAAAGIEVRWVDYSGYESYPQGTGEFIPDVSVLDLLFNTGAEAASHLKHGRVGARRGR